VKTQTTPLLLTLALASLLGACARTDQPGRAVEPVRGMTVLTLHPEVIPNEIAAPGVVRAVRTARLSAQVMAPIEQIRVREGDAVHSGQVLVVLDDRELQARRAAAAAAVTQATAATEAARQALASARAQAAVAEKTFHRYEFLQQQHSVSPQEFDEVRGRWEAERAAVAAAEAQLSQAEAGARQAAEQLRAATTELSYTRLRAPFTGVVLRRLADPGTLAVPGSPILELEDSSQYRLEVVLDVELAEHIRRGSQARITFDALGRRTFTGTVVELEPGADPASHTSMVKLALPHDSALRSGLFGHAWFTAGTRSALLIPETAVVQRGQLTGVFVVDATGIAHLRMITLGQAFKAGVEVLSGLDAGERIVANPGPAELDGRKLEFQP
jgi:RND family efflux transporter MFP subunit